HEREPMKLAALLMMSLGVGSQVVPCGNALCVGSQSPQQATNLGGTIQTGPGAWADGGIAALEPLAPGAILAVRGAQFDPYDGGANTSPDVVVGGRNTRFASEPVVSFRTGTAEVARVGRNSSFVLWLDGG